MPSSGLANQTVKEAGFRDKFNVNVLGIRRKRDYILQDLGRERMHGGDVLLVQGTWQDIARLSNENADWVVLGQALGRSRQGDAGLQSSDGSRHHVANGGADGI